MAFKILVTAWDTSWVKTLGNWQALRCKDVSVHVVKIWSMEVQFHWLSHALGAVNWSVIIPGKESQIFSEQGAGWAESRCARLWEDANLFPPVENRPTYSRYLSVTVLPIKYEVVNLSRLRLKCDGTRAETRFRLSAKRTSPFKSAGGVSSVD